MLFHLSLACVLSTAVAMAYPQAYSPPTYPPFGNTSHPQSPLSNAEFGLRMRVPNPINPYAGLVATKNGTSQQLLMVAHTLSGPDTAYDTTPAYTVGTESLGTQKLYGPNFVELNLDVNGTQYGLSTPDIGGIHGIAYPVTASAGYHVKEWLVASTGEVNHKLTAASQQFLACNATVNGKHVMILSWGSSSLNGTYPSGCTSTSVSVTCNVPGSRWPMCVTKG
ncbi:uncharacterized protein SEPMUDRAFT_153787 [Sphaerulina musiva SO2202]|uniref:Uncharacterized protein n=1 Tax=Sphaerulina musiva (strain SO2202) TaxID=692275 RepID=N1QL34_SPHMS|nr:uncharacterized protein SEPMUDRAFT_153787 [Sphaerulina musiva SO2202]EMF17976.1 hypothetical protein SEPMUDRAFT_153787 [Sphaerulina musiva SO2202]